MYLLVCIVVMYINMLETKNLLYISEYTQVDLYQSFVCINSPTIYMYMCLQIDVQHIPRSLWAELELLMAWCHNISCCRLSHMLMGRLIAEHTLYIKFEQHFSSTWTQQGS